MQKPIAKISYEGYWFTIPVGVSLVWDKFGKFALDLYKASGGEGGIPPVLPATADEWDGKTYVDVARFEIDGSLIPNKAELIKIAKQRGIDAETIEEWKEDEGLENDTIAKAINDLAVPDAVKYPEPDAAPAKKTATTSTKTDVADELLNGPATNTPTASTTTTPPAPTAPKAPAAPKARKAVAKAPGTPKAPKKGANTTPAAK